MSLQVTVPPRSRSFTDTSEYENCRPLLRSEGHVALVYKADRASGIERVGIENLLILFATRAAGRLIARRGDDPNPVWSKIETA